MSIPSKPVLLTGASGNLGRMLARELGAKGWTLRLTDLTPFPDPLPEKAKKARVIPEIADVPPKKTSQTAKKPQPLPEKSAGKANSISIG